MVILSFTPVGSKLTTAECEIAIAVMRGLSNAAIAAERDVSARTVANQIARLFEKLRVGSRAELASKLSITDLT